MARQLLSLRTALAGFLVAFLALAVIGGIVGVDRIVSGLGGADPGVVALALGATAVGLVGWGLSLHLALRTLGVTVTPLRSVLVYASAVFFNSLTPFAQVGGEALSAAVISRTTDARYETGLAAMTAVDVVNVVPTPVYAVVGLGWLAAAGTTGPAVRFVALAIVGIATAATVFGFVLLRFRTGVARAATRFGVTAVATVNRVTGRVRPDASTPIAGRIQSYLDGVRRVIGHRPRLAACLGLSVVAWGSFVVALWLSLSAVGHPIPLGLATFVLPVGMLALVVPLPGGVGGVEAALIGLLVTVGAVPVAGATAGVLLYRAITFWTPLLFGGVVTVALTVDEPGRKRRDEEDPG